MLTLMIRYVQRQVQFDIEVPSNAYPSDVINALATSDTANIPGFYPDGNTPPVVYMLCKQAGSHELDAKKRWRIWHKEP
jgi:hypothetical protein